MSANFRRRPAGGAFLRGLAPLEDKNVWVILGRFDDACSGAKYRKILKLCKFFVHILKPRKVSARCVIITTYRGCVRQGTQKKTKKTHVFTLPGQNKKNVEPFRQMAVAAHATKSTRIYPFLRFIVVRWGMGPSVINTARPPFSLTCFAPEPGQNLRKTNHSAQVPSTMTPNIQANRQPNQRPYSFGCHGIGAKARTNF